VPSRKGANMGMLLDLVLLAVLVGCLVFWAMLIARRI
jgi:hypothetical protein